MATKKDYQKGERVTVTRKNHHYFGQTGAVSEVYQNGLYVRFEDEKVIGMAYSTVRPALAVDPPPEVDAFDVFSLWHDIPESEVEDHQYWMRRKENCQDTVEFED